MKKILTALVFILLYTSQSFSQDATWVEDVTFSVLPDTVIGSRVYVVDINNDDYPDLIIGGPKATHNTLQVFLNVEDESHQGKRKYVDYTEESRINQRRGGLTGDRISDVAAFADVNNDGFVDVVTSIYFHRLQFYLPNNDPGDRSEVLLNDGTGKFTLLESGGLNDVPIPAAKPDSVPNGLFNTTGITFLDYDLDGNLDMYFATWFSDYAFDRKMVDLFFKGNGDATFTYMDNVGIEGVVEPMYGVNATDWNNDGWIDIVTSPYCRSDGSIFRNNGDGTFSDVTKEANYSANHLARHLSPANLCQWEAVPADFDNDGDIDILQTLVHGGYPEGIGRTVIAVNGGEDDNYRLEWDINRIQRDAPANSHLGDMGSNWFDLDGDGYLDMAIGQMSYPQANLAGQERLYVLRQNELGIFDDVSRAIGIFHTMKEAHSIEPIDYNMDGATDLVFSRQVRDTIEVDTLIDGTMQTVTKNRVYMQVCILENKIATREKNYSQIKLIAPENRNQSAIGSRITVYSDDLVQTREILAGNGHFAGQEHFIKPINLGDKNRIDSISVHWQLPEQPITTIFNPPLNMLLEIDNVDYTATNLRDKELENAYITFDKSHLDFESINTGEKSTGTFRIINIGNGNLELSEIAINEELSDIFSITDVSSELPTSIATDEYIEVEVEFSPEVRFDYRSFVEITSNAENGNNRKFDLEGFGFEPKPIIASSVEGITFDTTYIENHTSRMIEITNTGEVDLTINSITASEFPDVFKLAEETGVLPLVIEAGNSIEFEIQFHPQDRIDYEDKIIISSNAYNNENIEVSVSGVGDGPKSFITASTNNVGFLSTPLGESRSKTFMIENKGDGELIIESLAISFNNDSAFYIQDYEPPYTIAPFDAMTFEVIFEPKEVQNYTRFLTVFSNSFDRLRPQIQLRGSGIEPTSVRDASYSDNNLTIALSPNPASTIINIKAEAPNGVNIINSAIYDYLGNKVLNIESNYFLSGNKNWTLNASRLNAGSYYFVLNTENKTISLPITIIK